ncbi:pyridoxamine 5'-phosphate oxidase family protein [Tissierella carlieri]|jgi:nitroimidazol reductase NimA-like FMN-containing flavoprotein (pyridoxamine 5'-phosphate oxidase superfamily)|uniref:pyridoxamine 5'-phosphate oxidase family protein n=1 Tax=Tissierella TaxID=41273 RepID=UPI001F426B78|nr:pyridoxamine 5'-phosphate oxidase family protein [Tissierella sp. P1]MDU5082162.1 pyridoxamine 5'-phosphate oxidase family protein [Bacillota bacterium]
MKEMRRKDREMDENFAYSIIDKAKFGTLATIDEEGNPYCIPVSIARCDNKIYIHSAYQGSKIENIKRNSKICISFVGDVNVPPPGPAGELEKAMEDPKTFRKIASQKFTTEFESTVVFGRANIVEDEKEKILGLRLLSEKYSPWNMPYFEAAIEGSLKITCVIRIDIERITGKRKKYDKGGVEMKWGRME